jgi:hypothetical protein
MGVKRITSLPGLIFFEYDLIEFSSNRLRGGFLQKTGVVLTSPYTYNVMIIYLLI